MGDATRMEERFAAIITRGFRFRIYREATAVFLQEAGASSTDRGDGGPTRENTLSRNPQEFSEGLEPC